MIIENPERLKLWLTISLRPLCDADPAALAKYVFALIRKDKPDSELRQGMLDQLDVFLQNETIPFVDCLFRAINTNEYLIVQDDPGEGGVGGSGKGKNPLYDLGVPLLDTSTSSGSSQDPSLVTDTSELNTTVDSSSADSDVLNTSQEHNNSDDSGVSADRTFGGKANSNPRTNRPNPVVNKEKIIERDRMIRRNKSRSPRGRRSRSRERGRRSWSPKDYPLRPARYRPGLKRSPIRRSDREPYERRRSPVPRNRSSSPYSRARSPHRYSSRRGGYEPKRVRSPLKRSRSRSPARFNRSDGMDKGVATVVPTTNPIDQSGRMETTLAPKEDEYNGSPGGNRCIDFDERGLCMRGELCPFDHGQNPVVLQDVGVTVSGLKRTVQIEGPEPGLPYRGGEGQEFRLVRPTRPIISMEGELLNQSMPWSSVPPFHPGGGPRLRGGMMLRHPIFPMPPRELINVPVIGPPGAQMLDEEMSFPPMHMGLMYPPPQRGGHGGRGRGRGRGGSFDHSRLGMKPKVYTNCSLEVKRIPPAQNSISDLNSHFVQFGKIVNIQINFENDPEAALITFSSPNEAYTAYKSTEAVLNNRFIRVFWHNKEKENEETEDGPIFPRVSAKERLGVIELEEPMHLGVETERVLVSGINITKTLYNPNPQKREISQEKVQAVEAIKKSQEQLAAHEQLKRAQEEKKRETMKLMHDLQKKKQVMLIEQIEQQKKLIHKLETSKSMKPEEKDELMKLIKTLQESIETIKKGMDFVAQHQQPQSKHPPQPQQPIQQQPQPSTPKGEAARDILDAELDLYHTELEGGDTQALKQRVVELRAQARAAGVYPRGGRGGFRGMGPTRGGFAASRGGNISRTVDRRTTTILITGFPSNILPELMAHFAQYGLVPYHKPDYAEPSLTMAYESRKCAETAFTKGRVYKEHKLDIKWVQNYPAKDNSKVDSPPVPDDLDLPSVMLENIGEDELEEEEEWHR